MKENTQVPAYFQISMNFTFIRSKHGFPHGLKLDAFCDYWYDFVIFVGHRATHAKGIARHTCSLGALDLFSHRFYWFYPVSWYWYWIQAGLSAPNVHVQISASSLDWDFNALATYWVTFFVLPCSSDDIPCQPFIDFQRIDFVQNRTRSIRSWPFLWTAGPT